MEIKPPKQAATALHLLTARQVQSAVDGEHPDGGGLTLRIRQDCASWVLRYTSPSGRRREMGLGVAHRGSAAQAGAALTGARDLAHKARELLRHGVDPINERDKHRDAERQLEAARKAAAAKSHLTVARAARDYHERAIEPTRTSKHSAQWISSLENHVPASVWGAPISSITAPGLLTALLTIKAHPAARHLTAGDTVPETMQRIRQRLDAVFEDAIFHGHCTMNPAAAIVRKLRETLPPRKAGNLAALPYREAPAFMARLRAAVGTAARCLEFAVLTAARTTEALLCEWPEVDLEAGTWALPPERMKAGEPHTVALSARAVAVLKGQAGQHPRWVFPSTMKDDAPQSNMAMLAVLDRLAMRDHTTVHGLCRATFSTWAYETAAARPDVIEACLAHREADKIKAAYCRADFHAERAALLVKWAEFLAYSAQVIPLPARAA